MMSRLIAFSLVVLSLCCRNINGQENSASDPLPSTTSVKKKDIKATFRVPICSDENENYSDIEENLNITLRVFESKETYVNIDSNLESVEFVPYKSTADCSQYGYGYTRAEVDSDDTYGLIFNGSLYIRYLSDEVDIIPRGKFCVWNNITHQKVYVCLFDNNMINPSNDVYLPFLIISMICLAVSSLTYIFVLREKDVHRHCLTGYLVSSATVFLTLVCLQTTRNSAACNFIGGIFMFSLISSYTWLACLCMDMSRVVKSRKGAPKDNIRIYIYLAISLTIPVIILAYSLIPDGVPDIPASFIMPTTSNNFCKFAGVREQDTLIPMSALMLVSAIGLAYTCYMSNTHQDELDFEWMHNKRQLKYMLRSCFLVWITDFIWLIEIVANMKIQAYTIYYAIKLIEALLGIFLMLIFVLNKYVIREIGNVINEKKNKEKKAKQIQQLLENLQGIKTAPENIRTE